MPCHYCNDVTEHQTCTSSTKRKLIAPHKKTSFGHLMASKPCSHQHKFLPSQIRRFTVLSTFYIPFIYLHIVLSDYHNYIYILTLLNCICNIILCNYIYLYCLCISFYFVDYNLRWILCVKRESSNIK